MTNIFQYLQWGTYFDDDLFNGSLVSSCWLYHSWHPHSVYHVNLTRLLKQIVKYCNADDSNSIRFWQRFVRAKSIDANFYDDQISDYTLVLSKLYHLTNIENVKAYLHNTNMMNIAMFKVIMSRSKNKIKYYDTLINTYKLDDNIDLLHLSPLRLPKAISITIRDLYFFRSWSNKSSLEMVS